MSEDWKREAKGAKLSMGLAAHRHLLSILLAEHTTRMHNSWKVNKQTQSLL